MSLVAQTAATGAEAHCAEWERSPQISAAPDARPTWRGAHVRRRDDRFVGALTGRDNEQGVDGNHEEGGRHGRLPRGSAFPRRPKVPPPWQSAPVRALPLRALISGTVETG